MVKNLGMTPNGEIITENIRDLERLPNGNYRYIVPMGGNPFMVHMSNIKQVGDIFFTDKELVVYEDVLKYINPDVKRLMTSVKKTFKFNFLFYGPQGSGKGMFTQKVINELEGTWPGPIMVFNDDIDNALAIDRWVRTHFGEDHNILIVFIEDECERYMYDYKKILDSHISPTNMISFWITNRIQDIDDTIYIDRPSRIALYHEFGDLTAKESKQFIDFLVEKFKKENLMDEFSEEELAKAKDKLKNKSKDFISNELLMQLIMEKIN